MASKEGANKLGGTASTLAFGEGLQAHALSALYRTDSD
jgi:histidinol dehydrogenase